MNEEYVIGVDEAGRGPLAGPVAVGAVKIIDSTIIDSLFVDGVRDSKKMSERHRIFIYNTMVRYGREGRLAFSVGLVSCRSIDALGITASCTAGVGGVLQKLGVGETERIDLDGRLYAPKQFTNQQSHTRGDATYPSIALASVVAKVTRDNRMVELGHKYPEYNFEVHKGYGTKAHYDALLRHGLSPEHRSSFLTRFLKSRKNPHDKK
ncbi:MAG: ribonuclease HII [bacterium]|nr:ribonuclease HII [bacterium]